MPVRRWLSFIPLVALAACGGRATSVGRTVDSPASGGATPEAGASMATGAGGTSNRSDGAGTGGFGASFAVPPDSGTACAFSHEVCGGIASYLAIGGGSPVRLSYPADPGCGTCGGGICELWSFATNSCGKVSVSLSACAGPNASPPCLDTASYPGHYVDQNGRTWNWAVLATNDTSVETTSSGVLDFDATLSLAADGGTLELPAHVHVCGDIRALLRPC